MENLTFYEFFIVATLAIWIFLIVISLITVHTGSLKKKGYNDEYIKFIRKDTIKRNAGIALVMPLLCALSALIVWLFAEDINFSKFYIYHTSLACNDYSLSDNGYEGNE